MSRSASPLPRGSTTFGASPREFGKQIGDKLGISLPTVKLHRGNAAKKLGVRSAVAMAKALEAAGLLSDGGR